MSEKIKAAVESVRKRHKERDGIVTGMFLSVVSGRNMVFVGPEGTGKEELASDVCGAVDGKKAGQYIISASTSKSELTSKITNDTAALVLDDTFKANSETMNAVADMMSANVTIFGSSPDVPSESDEAYSLYDLFLFRAFIEPMRSDASFLSAVSGKEKKVAVSKFTSADIESVRKAAENISVDDDVLEAILSLRDLFKDAGKYVSDARWKDSVYAMKVAAAAAGEKSVSVSFLPLLQHTLWDWPEEIDEIRAAVFSVCTPGSLEMNSLYAESEELLRLSVESKGAVDESAGFPRIIHCYDCNSSFPTLKRLKEHSMSRPRHTYADPHIASDSGSQDYVKYSYEGLVTLLSSKYNWDIFRKSEASEKEQFLKEAKALRETKKGIESNYDSDRKKLMKGLEKNFWLTDQDKKDILTVFDLRSAEIVEIGNLIDDVEFILE